MIYLQSAVELETGSREQSSATNCQAGVTTWVSLGYGASDAWCEGSCVTERVVWPGGGGGGRRRLWRRSTPQQAFNQYPATTLIINNNNNTLKLTLISNRGTPLRGALTNNPGVLTPPRSCVPYNGANAPWASDWSLLFSISNSYL